MKVAYKIFIFLFTFFSYSNEINQSYVQVYGEGPKGRIPTGFEVRTYKMEDSVLYAKNEVLEFLSGMVYGYNFVYKVENKINNTKGYFDLIPISKIKNTDKNFTLSQYEESQISIRVQGTYRLNNIQKDYIRGFQSSIAKTASGTGFSKWEVDWTKRFDAYKDAIRDAVLNSARKNIKSRPQYIKGKVLLAESPMFSVVSGDWRVIVKVHLIITEVKYIDSY
ncbi:MAG TPA: hypothetical protein PLE45_06405 [Spirochaetota bacterium]|nr:hypothetical protein [Spirochaetota bacterium]HOL56890.1 hypothetical protein [Spirochaetota bacterium]HPP04472.1 hypothetical protein [Spirochaetota bacterium]